MRIQNGIRHASSAAKPVRKSAKPGERMRREGGLWVRKTQSHATTATDGHVGPALISIDKATFFQNSNGERHTSLGTPLFPDLDFKLPSLSKPTEQWAVLSGSSSARTLLLQILRGQHQCLPSSARTFPYLNTEEVARKDPSLRSPFYAIKYVGFDAERSGFSGANLRDQYLSARYESRRDETDFSLLNYLEGRTELNASEVLRKAPSRALLERVIHDLNLTKLVDMPASHLSNGQTRRAKIAKAILGSPELLLLDGPFMGLDPATVNHLSTLLHRLAEAQAPRLILSLKPDDIIPDWITHLLLIDENFLVQSRGSKQDVFQYISNEYYKSTMKGRGLLTREHSAYFHATKRGSSSITQATDRSKFSSWMYMRDVGRDLEAKGYLPPPTVVVGQQIPVDPSNVGKLSVDGFQEFDGAFPSLGHPVVEMEGVRICYGDKCVLGGWQQEAQPGPGLFWEVRQGQRWGVFGPNGSGKTTLLSLLTSDHPQSYSAPMKLFGRARLPQKGQPGLSLWDIQSRLGHSSPEVHTFFPRNLSLRRAIESAWADTPKSPVKLTHEIDAKVEHALRWFQGELVPSLGPTWQQQDELLRVMDPYAYVNQGGRRNEAYSSLPRIKDELLGFDEHPGLGLEWADETLFGEVSFGAQRIILFLRAVIRNPEFVILDEAFSGMDEPARDKCLLFLSHGENRVKRAIRLPPKSSSHLGLGVSATGGDDSVIESDMSKLGLVRVEGLQPHQALLVVSHNPAEVPGCVREWICLPEADEGKSPRIGRLDGPLSLKRDRWKEIWGTT